jgi:hypothetical protein
LDIVDVGVYDFDIFGLELSTETGTVEGSTCGESDDRLAQQTAPLVLTKNGCFVGIYVLSNLVPGNECDEHHSTRLIQ